MTDAINSRKLAADRLKDERTRALANTCLHINQMIHHLRVAQEYNRRHGLQLNLPDELTLERQLLAAMNQCAAIHKLDQGNNHEQEPRHP